MHLADFARRATGLFSKTFIILPLFGAAAYAQAGSHSRWGLQFFDDSGERYIDQPCGPFNQFKGDSKPFDSQHWFSHFAIIDDKVETERIGAISGFTVYNLTHNVEMSTPGVGSGEEIVVIKMILVERKAGEFCEIYQQEFQQENVLAKPAYFIDAGEKILATNDVMTGSGGIRIEAYWAFDKDGPVPLDLSLAKKLAEETLPAGYSFYSFPYVFGPDVDGGKVEALTFRNVACKYTNGSHPDNSCGWVSIDFEVKDHKLMAINKAFFPRPE